MAIDRSNFDDVTESDLVALQLANVPEGLVIEYKSQTYGAGAADKHEFLKDVSSFANTTGGHLLIGVTEKGGLLTAIPGLPGVDIDRELQRLEQMAQSGLEPRAQMRMRRISLANGENVVAIRIAQSWSAPHRVIAQNSNRFYRRNSAGCYEPSLEELRAMFNANNDLAIRIRSIREQRIRFIREGGLGRPLLEEGQLIMHVLPVASIFGRPQIDLSIVEGQRVLFAPLEVSSSSSFRYNLDGAVTERGDSILAGYTQVFRNGQIETTKSHVLRTDPKLGHAVPAFAIEKATVSTLRRLVAGLQVLDVPPPFIVGLTLIGCASAYYHTRKINFDDDKPPPVGTDAVFLPEGQIDGYGANEVIDAALRPAFDALWNSARYPNAAWFDSKGEWQGPPPSWTL